MQRTAQRMTRSWRRAAKGGASCTSSPSWGPARCWRPFDRTPSTTCPAGRLRRLRSTPRPPQGSAENPPSPWTDRGPRAAFLATARATLRTTPIKRCGGGPPCHEDSLLAKLHHESGQLSRARLRRSYRRNLRSVQQHPPHHRGGRKRREASATGRCKTRNCRATTPACPVVPRKPRRHLRLKQMANAVSGWADVV